MRLRLLPGSVPSVGDLPEHPTCPHCGSERTELMSPFGSVLANAQYYCNGCSTTFEFLKWEPGEAP